MQQAGLGVRAARRRPGRRGFEEDELDGVFIEPPGLLVRALSRRGCRRWCLPPEHRSSAGDDSQHKGERGRGVLSSLGRELLEQR
jgi:hypothetical protein